MRRHPRLEGGLIHDIASPDIDPKNEKICVIVNDIDEDSDDPQIIKSHHIRAMTEKEWRSIASKTR